MISSCSLAILTLGGDIVRIISREQKSAKNSAILAAVDYLDICLDQVGSKNTGMRKVVADWAKRAAFQV